MYEEPYDVSYNHNSREDFKIISGLLLFFPLFYNFLFLFDLSQGNNIGWSAAMCVSILIHLLTIKTFQLDYFGIFPHWEFDV